MSEDLDWLKQNSLLTRATELSALFAAEPSSWKTPYALPRHKDLISLASVWFNGYPESTALVENESVFEFYSNKELWSLIGNLGIKALHLGPTKLSGTISDPIDRNTPPITVDGFFDRIGLKTDPAFTLGKEPPDIAEILKSFGVFLVNDLVPGHTGLGYDFRLAERGVPEYLGAYIMIEIPNKYWSLLPSSAGNISQKSLKKLIELEITVQGRFQPIRKYHRFYRLEKIFWN